MRPGRKPRLEAHRGPALGRALAHLALALGFLLSLSGGLSEVAQAALGVLSLSVDTYNRDGSPGGGAVDFGVVDPRTTPVVSPAVVLHISSDLEWRQTEWADALPAGCVVETAPQGSGVWTPAPSAPTVTKDLQAPIGLTDFPLDLRLSVPWTTPPGAYAFQLHYLVAFTDTTPPTGGLSINGGAAYTNNPLVTLDLSTASDNSGVVDAVSFSADGATWEAWRDYTPTASRDLGADGPKTVWAKYRDRAGNESAAVSASITVDTVAPVISGVTAGNLTATSADISWTTAEAASSQVEYGLEVTYGSSTAVDGTPVMSHLVSVTGLNPGTTYHYRVRSADPATNEAVSTDQTLLTLPAAPTLSATTTRKGNTNYFDLSWTASAGAASYNVYRRDAQANGAFAVIATTTGTTYSDTLPSVTPYDLEYYVTAVNSSGESVPSNTVAAVGTTTPPTIFNIVATPDRVSCVVTWETDEPATSQVLYGTTSGRYSDQTPEDPTLVTNHSVTVTGLQAGTLYYFKVVSVDLTFNRAESPEQQFTTLPPTVPDPPQNLRVDRVIGQGNKIVLAWDPSPMATGYRLYSRDLLAPGGPGPWVLLTDQPDTSYTDGRYGPRGTYSYEYYVTAYNAQGESAPSATVTYSQP